MQKTYIWGIPIRLFHWFMVSALITAYLVAGDDFLQLHIALGYTAAVLVIFRILYGLIGPKYANFRDFPVSPNSIRNFIKSRGTNKIYFGHNPMASFIMLLILIMVLIVAITGTLNLASEGKGFFQITNLNGELVEELHEVSVYLLMALAVSHLLGLLMDAKLHPKHETTLSIFSGYKNATAENSKSNLFQTIFSFVWMLVAVLTFIFVLSSNTIIKKEKIKNMEIEKNEIDND